MYKIYNKKLIWDSPNLRLGNSKFNVLSEPDE